MDNPQQLIQSISPHQWFLIGGLVAAAVGGWGATELVKARHLKVKGEKLYSGFVVLNVTVWTFLSVAVNSAINSLGQITSLAKLLPTISPYVTTWGPRVTIFLLTTHTIVTILLKFWKDRKEQKQLAFISGLPDLSPAVQSLSGQQLAPQTVSTSTPPDNLFLGN